MRAAHGGQAGCAQATVRATDERLALRSALSHGIENVLLPRPDRAAAPNRGKAVDMWTMRLRHTGRLAVDNAARCPPRPPSPTSSTASRNHGQRNCGVKIQGAGRPDDDRGSARHQQCLSRTRGPPARGPCLRRGSASRAARAASLSRTRALRGQSPCQAAGAPSMASSGRNGIMRRHEPPRPMPQTTDPPRLDIRGLSKRYGERAGAGRPVAGPAGGLPGGAARAQRRRQVDAVPGAHRPVRRRRRRGRGRRPFAARRRRARRCATSAWCSSRCRSTST